MGILLHTIAGALALSTGYQALAAPLQGNSTCTNPRIRKEWRSQTDEEKKEYIRAVKCLTDSPPKLQKVVDNVHNRYEDFVVMHLNTTLGGKNLNDFTGGSFMTIMRPGQGETSAVMENHNAEQILPWHRWTIQIYEDVLREECGFTGAHPYWDYHLDSKENGGNLLKSPLFDAETGFGGNGAKPEPDAAPKNAGGMAGGLAGLLGGMFGGMMGGMGGMGGMGMGGVPKMPGGTGGGCVVDGPFKDLVLNVGPLGRMMGAMPRCLTRDLNPDTLNRGAGKANYARLLGTDNYLTFGSMIESPGMQTDFSTMSFGMMPDFHTTGHGSVGGEMLDPMNSVNDPIFWMHHAAMDRLWALWQEEKPEKRLANAPKTEMWVGPLSPENRKIYEVYDTQNRDGRGILCYKYEGLPFEFYFS